MSVTGNTIQVTFLGTGTSQGVPVIGCDCAVCQSIDYRDKRLRSSIHISVQGKSLVIDSGPDFRQQILNERIRTMDALLFTHEHKDHTAGMDDVRSFNFKQKKDMPVFAEPRVIEHLKKEFEYVFAKVKYPGVPQVEVHPIENKPFEVEGVVVTPIRVLHHKLPVFGFRVGDFTYITDANYIDEAEKEKIKGSKIMVLNALQKEDHISHFTFDQAIELIDELGVEKAYLTHISHKLGMHRKVERELPDHIELAFDGLQVSL